MKIARLLTRLKHRGERSKARYLFLSLVLIVAAVGVSVWMYTVNAQKKTQITELMPSKPTAPAPKPDVSASTKPEEKSKDRSVPTSTDSSNAQPAPTQVSKPKAEVRKPRSHTTEDPAYVICLQKSNDLYVKYRADNAAINAEKEAALAAVDESYKDAEYFNERWYKDREETAAIYNDRLNTLNSIYQANASVLDC